MRTNKIVYWIATGLFSAGMLMSASMYLTHNPKIVEGFKMLGYPPYFLTLLGTAKLVGIGSLLQQRFVKLKEWAYAGFTITLTGALWTHMATGTPFVAVIFFFIVLIISYIFNVRVETGKEARRLTLA